MRAECRDTATLDEPRLVPALREVLGRAARRPFQMLAVAVLASAVLVLVRATAQPLYVATLTFRMEEGDVQQPDAAPPLPRRIREYIASVALNRQQLLDLMEKHGVSERLRGIDPEAAVSSMREDIEIDVVRNYFLFDRERAGGGRSAQIVLSFTSGDRAEAQAIVHDLGAIVLESQAAARNAPLADAQQLEASQARLARVQLEALEAQRARLLASAGGAAGRAGAGTELAWLDVEISRALLRVQGLDARAAELHLARDAEQQQLGLRFQLVDESVKPLREPLDAAGIGRLAAVALLVVTPIVAVVLGAFDDRIYTAADVTSNGFPLLGAVNRLPPNAGAYDTRRRRACERKRPSP